MIVLGIESTAHTFGVGIVQDKQVLANALDAFKTQKEGMIPSQVAEHHVDVCGAVLQKALKQAQISLKEVDAIAFSQGPGIGNSLRIGAVMARVLSTQLGKPLVGVNHCIAHLEVGRLFFPVKDPVLLYASGANTQIIAYEAGKYRVFGETLDMGVGNFIDSFGRRLGLGFPAGPLIEQKALLGKKLVKLPYSVKGMDVSFGGMYTNLLHKIEKKEEKAEDLCFSVQEYVFAMLVEVAERAMAHTGKVELLLGGGVGCNRRLQEMCRIMCEERGATFYVPERPYLIDNGAMIAWTGLLMLQAKNQILVEDSAIRPYERTDDVEVNWR